MAAAQGFGRAANTINWSKTQTWGKARCARPVGKPWFGRSLTLPKLRHACAEGFRVNPVKLRSAGPARLALFYRRKIPGLGAWRFRRIIVEMVWRMVLFQPQYKPVQKWQEVLRGSNPALKKKAVVAIGRQLIVDLWRLETGRVTAQELNLVMVETSGV